MNLKMIKMGSFVYNDEVKDFVYAINDNKIELIYDNSNVSTFVEYKIKKNILTITDSLNNSFTYKRDK